MNTDTIDTATELNGEVQQEVQQEELQERPRISLEHRLGRVLADGASSDKIKDLIEEAEHAANAAEAEAKRLHEEALDLGCTNADAVEEQARAADLMVARLDAALPRLDDLLRRESEADYARKWRARRDRALLARGTMAARLSAYQEIAAQLVAIFQEVKYLDSEIIEPCNQARPAGEPAIIGCELYARKLDAFSRSMPSILGQVQLPQWSDSQRMVWPPKPVPLGVLVAGSMAPAYDPRFTSDWASAYDERRRLGAEEQNRLASFYDQQTKAREEREAREDQERAQRSG